MCSARCKTQAKCPESRIIEASSPRRLPKNRRQYGVATIEVLTALNSSGKKSRNLKKQTPFLCVRIEESNGYLKGAYARDKDAVLASMLITEAACSYFNRGLCLCDALHMIYKEHGYYKESVLSLTAKGLDGLEKMRRLMASLRENPPKAFGGFETLRLRDYQAGTIRDCKTGEEIPTGPSRFRRPYLSFPAKAA
jgi:phosphoglucomutase